MKDPAAPILARLYAQLDEANRDLASIGSPHRVWRTLSVYEVAVPSPVNPVARPMVGDALPCADCGELLSAGGCKPCPNCGTMSGGCA